MRIGIVSDTHAAVELTRNAIRMLESLEVETVLHCGDICSPEIVEMFKPWPTHFVFGNCDHDPEPIRQAIQATGQHCHEQFGELTLAGVKIALMHSHDRVRFKKTIHSGDYDLVCYGHTHVAAIDRHLKTLVVNPGAIYRANPHSIATIELPKLEATIIPL